MADFGQNDEVVSKSVASPKSSWGGDDEVITPPAPATSASAPVEGSSGAAFGMYPRPGMKPDDNISDAAKTARESFVRGLPGTGGFIAGAGAATTLAAPIVTPLTIANPIAGALTQLTVMMTGGIVGAGGVNYIADRLSALADPEGYAKWNKAKEQYPKSAALGSIVSGFAGSSYKTAPEVAGNLLSKPIVQRGVSGLLGGGMSVAEQATTGEGNVDLGQAAVQAVGGTALPGLNIAGRAADVVGRGVAGIAQRAFSKTPTAKTTINDLPEKPPESATPEERTTYIEKLKTIKAERDAKKVIEEQATKDQPDNIAKEIRTLKNERMKTELDLSEATSQDQEGILLDQMKQRLNNINDEINVLEDKLPVVTREEHKTALNRIKDKYVNLQIEEYEGSKKSEQINAELKILQDKETQLQKNIPAVEFKNPVKPTWEELHDHLWGSSSIGDAFDRVLATDGLGSKGQRALMKVLNQSEYIRDTGLTLSNEYIPYTDKYGIEQKAAGIYTGGAEHRIDIGATGNLRVLLHESMHSGTQRLVTEGTSPAAIRLKELHEEFKNKHELEYEAALEKFKQEKVQPTMGELRDFDKQYKKQYGLTDVHEFVSEAFTNKEFQRLLSGVKTTTPEGKLSNLWNDFKSAVREGLNIPEKERTALDEVFEQSATLIEESKGFKRESDTTTPPLPTNQSDVKETGSMQDVFDGKALKDSIYGFDLAAAQEFKRLGDLHTATIMQMGYRPRGEYPISAKNQEMLQEQAKKILKQQETLIDTYKSNSLGQLVLETNKALKPKLVVDNSTNESAPQKNASEKLEEKTSEPVAEEFKKLDPRSMPSEEAMLEHATDIYERYGEKDAIQFFDDYKKDLNERSIPVPNNYEQLDDMLHKVNTYLTKDRAENVIGYKENTVNGVTDEQRAKWFDMRERGEELPPEGKAVLDSIDAENIALVRKAKGMGLEVGEEFTTGQSRIRLYSEKEKPGWKETLKKFFSNDTPMGDKIADQVDSAVERKVFQADDGRVIELHRQPEDTKIQMPNGTYREVKKGTEIWQWRNGIKQMIGHSDNLLLKVGDKFETKRFSDKLSEGPEIGIASERRTLTPELTIVDGKVPEIERHSPYRYLHDAEASARIANIDLRKMVREAEVVENLKKSELFKRVGFSPDQPLKDKPKDWKVPSNIDRIPQLRGWHFDPKTAAIISDFAKVWDDSMYMKLSNAIVKNMMLNPVPHMFNEVMHLWNARGFTGWVDPRQLISFADTARVAWRDVGNQTKFYRDIMREGGSILGADPRNKGYFDTIIKDASKEIFGTPEMERSMLGLAKKLGTSVGDLYNGISNASQKSMWFTRDVMYVQLIREIMARQEKSGNKITLKEAIDVAERHMPNYRLPSEVVGSRIVSQVLRDPRVSLFSRYHYGMVKSLVNTLKDIDPRNLKTPEGRAHFREGVDSMIAIGVALTVLYPLMDKMAEAVFGEGAEQRRAGPFHLLHAGLDVYSAKKDASALVWPVFTFNPVLLTLGQLGLNKKIFSGKNIYHPDDDFATIMGDVGMYTAGQIPQVPPVMSATADEGGESKLLARQLDIKVKTDAEKKREERVKKYQETSKKTRDKKREKETYRR